MTTDDPILYLERQLVDAATRRGPLAPRDTSPVAPLRRRHRLRPRALVAAGTAVGVLAAAALIVFGGPGRSPSLAEAAEAKLAPDDGVVHLTYTSQTYDGAALLRTVTAETWYSATTVRTLTTSREGESVSSLETVRTPDTVRSYEPSQNVLAEEPTCPRPTAERMTDPVAELRRLLAAGHLTPDGEQQFGGQDVQRLAHQDGPKHLVFFVRPNSGDPVGMETDVNGLDRTTIRFTGRATLPASPDANAQLRMAPHPGARLEHPASDCG